MFALSPHRVCLTLAVQSEVRPRVLEALIFFFMVCFSGNSKDHLCTSFWISKCKFEGQRKPESEKDNQHQIAQLPIGVYSDSVGRVSASLVGTESQILILQHNRMANKWIDLVFFVSTGHRLLLRRISAGQRCIIVSVSPPSLLYSYWLSSRPHIRRQTVLLTRRHWHACNYVEAREKSLFLQKGLRTLFRWRGSETYCTFQCLSGWRSVHLHLHLQRKDEVTLCSLSFNLTERDDHFWEHLIILTNIAFWRTSGALVVELINIFSFPIPSERFQ